MSKMTYFLTPGACSRVSLTALEHVGADYNAVMIDLAKGEQREPAYLATNPRGKTPALVVDGQLLTENVATLSWLNMIYPDAGLLPNAKNDWEKARQISDLTWISATWHPYVRANMMPIRWTTGDPAPVREQGKILLRSCMDELEAHLCEKPWWYGDQWSIVDTYFYWCYTTAELGEFPMDGYDAIADHRTRVEAQRSFQRALERERRSKAEHG